MDGGRDECVASGEPWGVSTWAAITDDGGAENAADGAPTCALDSGAIGANDANCLPCGPRDTTDLEQPASIPSTARNTPTDRRPLIHLLSH